MSLSRLELLQSVAEISPLRMLYYTKPTMVKFKQIVLIYPGRLHSPVLTTSLGLPFTCRLKPGRWHVDRCLVDLLLDSAVH